MTTPTTDTDIIHFLYTYSEMTPEKKKDPEIIQQVISLKKIIEAHLPQGAMKYLGHGIILGEASGDIAWIKEIIQKVKNHLEQFDREDFEDLQVVLKKYE